MDPTVRALRAYAAMINTGDVGRIAPLLPETFCYESQTVFEALDRDGFLEYMRGKLAAIDDSDGGLYAEMGEVQAYGRSQPCVILAQPTKADLVALVLATVEEGVLLRLDLCIVPSADRAHRSGDYPV